MDLNKKKKEYIRKQKNKIEDSIIKTGQLLPAFQMCYQSGDINIFSEFLEENNLQEAFVENALEDLANLSEDNQKMKKCFIKLIESQGLSYLKKVYGQELGIKLENLYKIGKIGLLDFSQIVAINKETDVQKQGIIIGKILDLYENDDLEIGIHRTGGWKDSGKIINSEGLILSGHIASGANSNDYTDIKSKLEQNVSLEKHPGTLILSIATGGNYKNILGKEYVDISVIAIPKQEFEKKEQEIIINKGEELILNPKFIKGYVTVNSRTRTLNQYVENPKYISEQKYEETENTHTETKKWLNRFKNWEQTSEQSRLSQIKAKIMTVFHNLSPKSKKNVEKQSGKEKDERQ